MDDILIFVDGELYQGVVIFNPYKGVGWPSGRQGGFFLVKDKAARYQEVIIVYLKYGKSRMCKYNNRGYDLNAQLKADTTYWEVIDMPGDHE
jgi:hypothetical protein